MQRCVVLMSSARRFHHCRHKSSMCLHWHSISEFQVQASQFNSKGLLLTLKHHKNHRRLSDETLGSTQSDKLERLVWRLSGVSLDVTRQAASDTVHRTADCARQQLTTLRDAGRTWLKS